MICYHSSPSFQSKGTQGAEGARTDLLVRVVDDAVDQRRDGAFLGFPHVAAKMLAGGQTAGRHTQTRHTFNVGSVHSDSVSSLSRAYLAGSL